MEAGLAEELEGGNEEGEIVLASARSEKIALGEGELGWDEATGVETLELAAVVAGVFTEAFIDCPLEEEFAELRGEERLVEGGAVGLS